MLLFHFVNYVLYCCLCNVIVMVIYFYLYVYSVLFDLIHCFSCFIVCVQICSVLLPPVFKAIAVKIYLIILLSNTLFTHLNRTVE
jgi:hypothetical protein